MEWSADQVWYHGSPVRLTFIRAGSTITPDPALARVFSHKPAFVVQDIDDVGNRKIKHSGTQTGFLYWIAEELRLGDAYPHPHTTMAAGQEWLTTRELQVRLIGPTQIVAEEALTAVEIEEIQHRLVERR